MSGVRGSCEAFATNRRCLGGIGGALGGVATAVFATSRGWPFALPGWILAGAAGATVLVGAIAGAYPAARAARMSPTAALATV